MGFNTSNIDTSLLKELSEDEKIAAIKAVKEGIDCMESNAVKQAVIKGKSGHEQYIFAPEEVQCEVKGREFEILKLKEKLSALRSQKNYDLAQEAYLLDQIKRCELIIEYRTKGQQMYELYTQTNNSPINKTEVLRKIKTMQAELNNIQDKRNAISAIHDKPIVHVETNEYKTYQARLRPEMGLSIGIPYSTTIIPDIFYGNMIEQS